MNDNVLTMDSGALADAMQSVRRSLKMADRLAGSYIPPMGGERYLTDRDLAERLHVSRRTLQQYRHEGILPYFLFGGKTLYRESDVQKVPQGILTLVASKKTSGDGYPHAGYRSRCSFQAVPVPFSSMPHADDAGTRP